MAGFRSRSKVRVFAEGWGPRAAKFAPESIAATLEQLEELMLKKIAVSHSVIILERAGEPTLTRADRDRLWRAFEAPLFEQMISAECELLAFECDAHEGLHVVSASVVLEPQDVNTSVCGCGRTSPRLISRAQRTAAYARGMAL